MAAARPHAGVAPAPPHSPRRQSDAAREWPCSHGKRAIPFHPTWRTQPVVVQDGAARLATEERGGTCTTYELDRECRELGLLASLSADAFRPRLPRNRQVPIALSLFTLAFAVAILAGGGYTREPNSFNDGWRGRFGPKASTARPTTSSCRDREWRTAAAASALACRMRRSRSPTISSRVRARSVSLRRLPGRARMGFEHSPRPAVTRQSRHRHADVRKQCPPFGNCGLHITPPMCFNPSPETLSTLQERSSPSIKSLRTGTGRESSKGRRGRGARERQRFRSEPGHLHRSTRRDRDDLARPRRPH